MPASRSTAPPVRTRAANGDFGTHRRTAAGKLAALLARRATRDLFDAHHLLLRGGLDPQRLRIAFVVYGAMNRKDWRTVSADDITFAPRELRNQLVPTLRPEALGDATAPIAWARSLNDECRNALRVVLPLAEAESEFPERLLDHGEIVPGPGCGAGA